ncbi:hypothetical protein LTR84_000711 [Exophiala bonariae]|uniref:Uncharacterized protein n=1 Tax=Exophiala bonariae TaxID=1690606 RepID=A0AAV9NU39_9EURO|nr:hypothetical protein LTR84_000711 [Exophiala bonariae]
MSETRSSGLSLMIPSTSPAAASIGDWLSRTSESNSDARHGNPSWPKLPSRKQERQISMHCTRVVDSDEPLNLVLLGTTFESNYAEHPQRLIAAQIGANGKDEMQRWKKRVAAHDKSAQSLSQHLHGRQAVHSKVIRTKSIQTTKYQASSRNIQKETILQKLLRVLRLGRTISSTGKATTAHHTS